MKHLIFAALCGISVAVWAQSADITVAVSKLDPERGDTPAGEIVISQSKHGAVFTPKLTGVEAGIYGFHVHENPSCAAQLKDGKLTAGLGAGGHWDPERTGAHKGPWDDGGHLGDLPALAVDAKGHVQPVLAPRIKDIGLLRGRSLMIHAGGDNYSDHPAALGGGGGRMICGVVK